MQTRREFLKRTLQGSSLVALSASVPGFLASTARAAEAGKGDRILVVLEMTGGNDGLNMVVPYADDLYHKARPTLGLKKEDLLVVDDHVGLNNSMSALEGLIEKKQLAIVQGVGYPNPNRSHFESMDVWQSADPAGKVTSGWLGRSLGELKFAAGGIPAFHVGQGELPRAMRGSSAGVPSFNTDRPFGLDLGDEFFGHRPPDNPDGIDAFRGKSPAQPGARRKLIEELTAAKRAPGGNPLQFVQRASLDTYATIERLGAIMKEDFQLPEASYRFVGGDYKMSRSGLVYELSLVARMIAAGFGSRLFYVAVDGFDTHGDQRADHDELLATVAQGIGTFFDQLAESGHADRVLLLTFSEFGRRVAENGSKGTDHGAGSCLFVAGPKVRGGPIGKHPSLADGDLDSGDLKHHIDFRQVYATLLDRWLACDSRRVLGERFEHVPLL